MTQKLTNDRVDNVLKLAHMNRLSTYNGSKEPITIQCTVCNNIRTVQDVASLLYNIKRGAKSCPGCSGLIRHMDNTIDERIKDRNIKRLTSYVNDPTPIEWQCLSCNHTWSTRLTKVINEHTSCPKCSYVKRAKNHQIPHEDMLRLISDRPLTLIGSYNGMNKPTTWLCTLCTHTWITTPTKVIHSYTGCPNCPGHKALYGKRFEFDGHAFQSVLERDCYLVIKQSGLKFEQQKRYPHNVRMRCDFYFPDHRLWLEMSNITSMQYMSRILLKQHAIQEINERFELLTTPTKVRKLMNTL